MNKNKIITIIRYLSLFFIVVNTLNYSDISSDLVIFLLFTIIVNSQFRFFTLRENNKLMLLSLLFDVLLVFILSRSIKSINILYFIPIVLDISFFISKELKYILLTFSFMIFIVMNLENSSIYIIENALIFILIVILFIYIYEESINTLKYQTTYDKLRISEDKLRRANAELEVYINSVEELAILKERNRISREIHDSVGHSLSATIIQLGAIENLLKSNPSCT